MPRGSAPFHTFPRSRGQRTKFAAIVFCALGYAPLALTARRPGNADLQVDTAARSAAGGPSLISTEGAVGTGTRASSPGVPHERPQRRNTNGDRGTPRLRSARRFAPVLSKCGESRTETPEQDRFPSQERLGVGSPDRNPKFTAFVSHGRQVTEERPLGSCCENANTRGPTTPGLRATAGPHRENWPLASGRHRAGARNQRNDPALCQRGCQSLSPIPGGNRGMVTTIPRHVVVWSEPAALAVRNRGRPAADGAACRPRPRPARASTRRTRAR